MSNQCERHGAYSDPFCRACALEILEGQITPEEKLAAEMYPDRWVADYDSTWKKDCSNERAAFLHGIRLGDAAGYARAKAEALTVIQHLIDWGTDFREADLGDARDAIRNLDVLRALSPTSPAPGATTVTGTTSASSSCSLENAGYVAPGAGERTSAQSFDAVIGNAMRRSLAATDKE